MPLQLDLADAPTNDIFSIGAPIKWSGTGFTAGTTVTIGVTVTSGAGTWNVASLRVYGVI